MSTISQGSLSTDKAGVDSSVLQKTSQVEEQDSINRGYSTQNSISSVAKQEDAQLPKIQHRMEPPAEGADTPSEKVLKEIAVFKEIQNAFNTDPEVAASEPLGGDLLKLVDQKFLDAALGGQNPLSKHISSLQSNKEHLLSLGYSEDLIEGLLSLADPDDPGNSLSSMHSFSARLGSRLNGDPRLQKLYDHFGDTLNRVANLKGGPAELHTQLRAELTKFTGAFLGSKKHLDMDAATLMLMQIQTQLQNNRLIFNQQNIKVNQAAKEQISEKRMNKILDSINKAEEAKDAGVVSKIFGGIAVAIMSIVAAIMVAGAVFTGGASAIAAAALMVGATALVVTMMVSAETGNWMTDMFGTDQDSQIGAMVFWSVLILAMTLGAAGVTGVAGSAASAANATAAAGGAAAGGGAGGATVTATATTAATAASRAARISDISARFSRILRVVGGAAMVGDGSASAVSTTYQYDADMFRAEAKEFHAWMLHNQHVIDDLLEDISKVIDELQSGYQVIASILKDNHDNNTKLLGSIKA